MKQQAVTSEQLCFSIGRPLPVLLEEIQKSSRNPQLIKAAEQMLESLRILEKATAIGVYTAIYEILTK